MSDPDPNPETGPLVGEPLLTHPIHLQHQNLSDPTTDPHAPRPDLLREGSLVTSPLHSEEKSAPQVQESRACTGEGDALEVSEAEAIFKEQTRDAEAEAEILADLAQDIRQLLVASARDTVGSEEREEKQVQDSKDVAEGVTTQQSIHNGEPSPAQKSSIQDHQPELRSCEEAAKASSFSIPNPADRQRYTRAQKERWVPQHLLSRHGAPEPRSNHHQPCCNSKNEAPARNPEGLHGGHRAHRSRRPARGSGRK